MMLEVEVGLVVAFAFAGLLLVGLHSLAGVWPGAQAEAADYAVRALNATVAGVAQHAHMVST